MKTPILTTLFAAGMISASTAAIVLSEDFEDADVTTAVKQFPTDTAALWLSNQSFKGFDKWMVDENTTFTAGNSTGTFDTPDGEQGFTFGYNAQNGMTTKEGVLGTYDAEGSMTLDFLWGKTSDQAGSANIYITFYAFNATTTADSNRSGQANANPTGTENVDWVFLGSRTAYNSSSSTLSAFQHSLTLADPSIVGPDVTGWDLAVRIGAENFQYGVLDNLQLDITLVPEPSTALLGGLGGLFLLRRRRA